MSDAQRREEIEALLSAVVDPELDLDVVNLGLIYGIEVEGSRAVITYTLTTPGCPYGEQLEAEMAEMARQVDGVEEVRFQLTFSPRWDLDKLSEDARFALGLPT